MIAQCVPRVIRAEKVAPLQFGDDDVDEVVGIA